MNTEQTPLNLSSTLFHCHVQ